MLSELLNFALIETRAVGTAAEALSLLQAEHFDLYLLDAWLPDLDGVELCRRVRLLDPHTPVLFYSGAAYDSDKKRAIDAGANAYVTKPDVDGFARKYHAVRFQGHQCRVILNLRLRIISQRCQINKVCLPNNNDKTEVW